MCSMIVSIRFQTQVLFRLMTAKNLWIYQKGYQDVYCKADNKERLTMASKARKNRYLDSFASHDIPTGIPSVVGRKSATS